jgi:nickel transport protein
MKKGIISLSIAVFFIFALIAPVTAHNMDLIYKTKEIEVFVEFEGGSVAREAKVKVFDPAGNLYVEGTTDENGTFSFEPGKEGGKWKITAEHSGHKETVLMEGSEVQSGGSIELPLYTRIAAGFGYLIGIAGIALIFISRKTRKKETGNRISSD